MSDDNMDDDTFEGVNDLIEQLQGGTGDISDIVEASEKVNLTRDQLEEFILENQATLIKDSVDVLQIMKQYVAAAPNAEDVESFAELLRATSTAIDNLAKLHTSNQRVDTQVKVKQMDIDAKKINNDNNNKTMLIGTREEIFKKMLSDSNIIDISTEEVVEDTLDLE